MFPGILKAEADHGQGAGDLPEDASPGKELVTVPIACVIDGFCGKLARK